MQKLPDGPRKALELFHLEGLPYQEVGRRLGVPLGTVATWVTRGRKAMAEALEDENRERPAETAGWHWRDSMSDTNDRPPTEPGALAPPAGASSPELLPDNSVWASGGHASDVVLTALADGQQAIVPPAVLAHVERCTTCTTHLGHAALLSLHAGAELEASAEHELVAARRPLPRLAIALGLVVAALGLLPSIVDAEDGVSAARSVVTRDVPLYLKGIATLARRLGEPGSAAGLFVTYATAALLVVMGIAVVRILPKAQKENSR